MRLAALTFFLLCWPATTSPTAADEGRHSTGGSSAVEPSGRTGVSVLPASYLRGEVGERLPADGFSVHLVSDVDPNVERIFPCGVELQLPAESRYRMWVEGHWRISPFSYSATAIQDLGERVVVLPVVQAGRVVLPNSFGESHQVAWLLSLEPRSDAGVLRSELSRRRPVADQGDGILMPAGRAVAAIWDPRRRSYVALSRPFEVRAGETVEAPLERPGRNPHVVAEVERSTVAPTGEDDRLDLTPASGGEPLPGVSLSTSDRLYGFWYRLEPSSMRLDAASAEDFMWPSVVFEASPGRVEHLASVLDPRPTLDVEMVLPAALAHEEITLELRTLPEGQAFTRATLELGATSHRFTRLASGLFEVELRTRLGNFTQQVDLSSAESGFVLLEPDWIVITGTVFHGGDPHPAKLTFLAVNKTSVGARTGPDGAYEIVSLVPLRGVSISLDGIEAEPYVDFFLEALARSEGVDFHLPDRQFTAEVVDAATGEGIAEAQVVVRNEFLPKAGEERGSFHDKAIFQTSVTDRDGLARLPPLRPGNVELRASAPGYFQMRDPLIDEILEEDRDRTFRILLEPTGDLVEVRLKLPNGQPAAGADVLLTEPEPSASALFSARTDEHGAVGISRASGVLLIRHPDAAFLVRDWRPDETLDKIEWALPRASPRPLNVRVENPWTHEASPRAWLAIWVDGRRLSGRTLAWLTGARPAADNNGYWKATNLPERTTAILAWPVKKRGAGDTGLLDSLATELAYPWPDLVEIEVSE